MNCRFCESKDINTEIINDRGLDHHSYKLKENHKKYAICQNCFSIYRLDNNIASFISNDYVKYERYGAKASKNFLSNKKFNNKGKKSISFRDIEILNAIERHEIMKDTDVVCDFGANKGELLSEIKDIYKTKKGIGVELDMFKNIDYGYHWFGKITDAVKNNQIDLLIASHSLVLTDYSEFKKALAIDNNIKHIIIVSQNPLNRPATLFYDDCISNPSIQGKSAFLINHGYKIIEAGFLPNHQYETIVIASKTIPKHINLINDKNNQGYSIKEEKFKILKCYEEQAKTMNDNDINCIFGTGIDSSILYYQFNKQVFFAKDNPLENEFFLDSPVLDINKFKNKKIIIPKFLSNSEKIYQRLKDKKLDVFL